MAKYLISIFILAVLIGGVGYFGYYNVYQNGNLVLESESTFAELDTHISEIEAFSIDEETVAMLEENQATSTDQKIDNIVSDLTKFQDDKLDSLNVDIENI